MVRKYSEPKRKEADKLEFVHWPHRTRFGNWKTSFQPEVITRSTHPRQASEWLAEISQTKSMQDLDDDRISIWQHQDEIRNLGFPSCERSHGILNPDFKEESSGGRQIAPTWCAFFWINDVQVRVTRMNGLLQVELVNNNLKKVRSVLERNSDGAEEGTRRRSFGRPLPSTVGEIDLYYQIYMKLKAVVTAAFPHSSEANRTGERSSNPGHHRETRWGHKKQIAGSDYHKGGAQVVRIVHSDTIAKIEAKKKQTRSSGLRVRQAANSEFRRWKPNRQKHVRKRWSDGFLRFSSRTSAKMASRRLPNFSRARLFSHRAVIVPRVIGGDVDACFRSPHHMDAFHLNLEECAIRGVQLCAMLQTHLPVFFARGFQLFFSMLFGVSLGGHFAARRLLKIERPHVETTAFFFVRLLGA